MNNNDWLQVTLSIVVAIIGLSTISVVLSKQANTSAVITSASKGLSTIIGAAVSPVTGGLSTGLSPLA